MEPPNAHAERPEPIPYRPETGQHIDRGNRNELVELARCRRRAWRRAPAVEEARGRRERIAVAFEAGRDGFWLARWLRARGIEAHVIHASSVAVSREHRRADGYRQGARYRLG